MMWKRIAGGVTLLAGVFSFSLAGVGPLEGPVGLAIGVGFGALFSIVGGVLIGKSILDNLD